MSSSPDPDDRSGTGLDLCARPAAGVLDLTYAPAPTGLKAWSVDDIAAYLNTGFTLWRLISPVPALPVMAGEEMEDNGGIRGKVER